MSSPFVFLPNQAHAASRLRQCLKQAVAGVWDLGGFEWAWTRPDEGHTSAFKRRLEKAPRIACSSVAPSASGSLRAMYCQIVDSGRVTIALGKSFVEVLSAAVALAASRSNELQSGGSFGEAG